MRSILFAIGVLAVAVNLRAEGLRSEEQPIASTLKAPDPSGQVTILCYHRFEASPRDGLAISPEDFRQELQSLKDRGIGVISMADFLAWQRGEKSIPEQAAVITMDDGYDSCKEVAWPILREFGYPFTMFIYTDYVKGGPRSGGKSLSWDELREMQAQGVEFGSHSLSHSALNARKGRSDEEYRPWLKEELGASKAMLEKELGIPISVIAYPYGLHNETVREVAREVGYEAGVTVAGRKIEHGVDLMQVGRYAIDSKKPEVFRMAADFGQSSPLPASAPVSTEYFPTNPAAESRADSALPTISIDLSSLGKIDPDSIEVRVSGLGEVPAKFDSESGTVVYPLRQRLYGPEVKVDVVATADGKKRSASWSYEPSHEVMAN